jgi:hypothetical protein
MSEIMTFDIGTQESLKKIFATLLINPKIINDEHIAEVKLETYSKGIGLFLHKFPVNVFFNEYYFIYQTFKKSTIRIFSKEQIASLIAQNQRDILSSPYINITTSGGLMNGGTLSDGERIELFTEELCDLLDELTKEVVSYDEFESACNQYLITYRNQYMLQTSNAMSMIMQPDGYIEKLKGHRTKHWQGENDCAEYYTYRRAHLAQLDEDKRVSSITVDEDYALKENNMDAGGEEDGEALLDYGIKEIDDFAQVMRRTHLVNIIGITKGGKSTFSNYLVERALRKGLNVAVWALEGSIKERQAVIESLCAYNLENDSRRVTRNEIMSRNYSSNDNRQAIANARTIIASPQYGNLTYITGTAYVEDFESVLIDHYTRVNKFDVLVVDSPILMLSRYGAGKVERVSEGIVRLKNLISTKLNCLCIMTAQIKQEHIDKLRSKPNETIDVTAGGDSAEVTRTPDDVIGLFSSKLERSNGQMKMSNIASRHHEAFPDFYVGCDLAIGNFFSNPELNE